MYNVFEFVCYRDFLIDVFKQRAQRNKRYSMRAFARDLGILPATLTSLSKREDRISCQSAEGIADSLKLEELSRRYFIELIKFRDSRDSRHLLKLRELYQYQLVEKSLPHDIQLSTEDFAVFIKIALNKHIECTDEDARLMDREPEKLWEACERLVAAGYIVGNKELGWSTHLTAVLSNEDQMKRNRLFHRQYMMVAADAFHKPPEERFFYSSYVSLAKADYEDLCRKIQDFILQKELTNSPDVHSDMIYLLGAQLIPLDEVKVRMLEDPFMSQFGKVKRSQKR